jgi:hypothetical protein
MWQWVCTKRGKFTYDPGSEGVLETIIGGDFAVFYKLLPLRQLNIDDLSKQRHNVVSLHLILHLCQLQQQLTIRESIILVGYQNKSLLLREPLNGTFSPKILDIT